MQERAMSHFHLPENLISTESILITETLQTYHISTEYSAVRQKGSLIIKST